MFCVYMRVMNFSRTRSQGYVAQMIARCIACDIPEIYDVKTCDHHTEKPPLQSVSTTAVETIRKKNVAVS